MLTVEELYQEANTLCLKHWGVPYTGKIELVNRNWRYQTACIEFRKSCPTYAKIRMSQAVNERRTKEEILSTLLHELVHWRLRMIGKPYKDEDKEFVEEALRVGASISWSKSAREALKKYGTRQMTIDDYLSE